VKVLGLTGPARSGKDTVAQFVLEEVPGAVRQGFADKLKLSAARIFYPDIDLDGALSFCNTLKTEGWLTAGTVTHGETDDCALTGREFLQRYGTEAHRDVFGQDFWLDAVLPDGRDDCPLLVIPDVRFDNEAQRVRERGGTLVHINRPEVQPVEAHASEAGIPAAADDWVLHNTGSLEELRGHVREALAAIYEEDA
jgi:hypothetical protein